MTESLITRLQSQGVDISAVQTAIQNNDTATVNAWLTSFFESAPGDLWQYHPHARGTGFTVNATARQAHLQSFITHSRTRELT